MYETEDQQIEAVKKWFKENGTSILLSIIVAVAVVFGWQGWNQSQQDSHEAASELYQNMIEALALTNSDTDSSRHAKTVKHLGEQLIAEHANLHYAYFAGLALAKVAVQNNDFDEAEKQLRWVLEQNGDESITSIARIRLAHVLASQGNIDEGLSLLAGQANAAFKSLNDEARGDLYLQLGNEEQARMAYQSSIDFAKGNGARENALVQLKLNDLAKAP